jgi:hypothetical protein
MASNERRFPLAELLEAGKPAHRMVSMTREPIRGSIYLARCSSYFFELLCDCASTHKAKHQEKLEDQRQQPNSVLAGSRMSQIDAEQ